MVRTAEHEIAVDGDVPFADRVPEGQIGRVEGPVGDDGFLSQLLPMDPVRRGESVQRPSIRTHGFVEFGGGRLWVRVLEGEKGPCTPSHPDDVVVPGSFVLEEPQRGPGPVDPVSTLGVARGVGVFGDHLLTRFQQRLQGVSAMTAAPVVHSVEVAVLEDYGSAATGHALPGTVEDHHLSGGPRGVELEFQIAHGVDEVVVDEELQPGIQFPDLAGSLQFLVLPAYEGWGRDQDQDE